MKKVILAILTTAILCTNLSAQSTTGTDTLWRKGGIFSLNFNQVSLSNWAAGGENSVAFSTFASLFANYKKDKIAWDNSIDLGYGLLKQGDADFRKNEDKIDFTSKWGYQTKSTKWYYSALFNFKSQFDKGYAYPDDSNIVSKFAAPAYFLFSAGMDFKPNNYFSLFLSPLTAKLTLITDQDIADAGAYGNEKAEYDASGTKIKDGETLRSEFGAYLNAKFQKDVVTNLNLMTKLELFSNYTESPQNIDVNWEVMLAMKINKFMTASIYTQLIYDNNVAIPLYEGTGVDKVVVGTGPRVQFKEVLGIGINYKFDRFTVR